MGKRAPVREIKPARVAGGLGRELLDGARFVVDDDRAVIGYMLVALHSDGTMSRSGGTAFDNTPMPINSMMFIGMVCEAAREHLSVRPTAREMVNHANGYEDE
jgi:hypothetical protein